MSFVGRCTSWFARHRFVLGVFGAWIVVAAVSTGPQPGRTGWVGVPDLGSVLVGLFGLMALAGLALYIYILRGDRAPSETTPRRRSGYWIAALVFLGLFAVLRLVADDPEEADGTEDDVPGVVTTEFDDGRAAGRDGREAQPVGRAEVAAAAAATAVAAIGLAWLRRTDAALGPDAEDDPPSVVPAIDRAIADLELGDDPRLAVLRAYASLEQALATQGLGRHPTETTAEHLRRTLGALAVDRGELGELGLLYERARFSADPTPDAARERAREILDRARVDLRPADPDVTGAHR